MNAPLSSKPVVGYSGHPWIVAITGASGTVYARRLITVLVEMVPDVKLDVIVSEAGMRVLREEEGISVPLRALNIKQLIGFSCDRVRLHNPRDIGASVASGSYPTAGMVIVPCSMGTLAAVAHGYSINLIHRAADVTIKEGRKLILVPRETPLSTIHLENMIKLSRLGVSIVPAMPGFYHKPRSIEELVNLQVIKITDQMGFSLNLSKRWKTGVEAEEHWPLKTVSSTS